MYYSLPPAIGRSGMTAPPLRVNRATAERARAMLSAQPLSAQLDPAQKAVWFRTHGQVYIPYWATPEYRERDRRMPERMKSDLLYVPYWMKDKAQGTLVQRPELWNKTKSHVLVHLGTDEDDGLGKGFHFPRPFKALKRATHFTSHSFRFKNIMGAIGSVAGTIATGGLGPLVAPKVFSANSKTMQAVGMATTAIAVVAGSIVLGPEIAAALGPVLSSAASMLGRGVETFGTFTSAFFQWFHKKSPDERKEIAQTITPQQVAGIEQGTVDPNQLYPNMAAGYTPSAPRVPLGQENFGKPLAEKKDTGSMMPLAIAGSTLIGAFFSGRKR